VQLVDARDLAAFVVDAGGSGLAGKFNVVGPASEATFADMIAACERAAGVEARPMWVGDDHLLRHSVEPWQELPLWLKPSDRGFCRIDNRAARAAGLGLRSLDDTVRDILAWDTTRPAEERVDPMPREREETLLATFARSGVRDGGDG
jgi:2'-hydroxyisoflavone reductase